MTNYEFFNDKKINYLSHIAEKTKEIENTQFLPHDEERTLAGLIEKELTLAQYSEQIKQ